MARQAGTIQITGTIGQLCFYKLHEGYYVRTKSSLTGERVKKDPAFRNTMLYAGLLKQASVIASSVYQQLDNCNRKHSLYRELTGAAMRYLKSGQSSEAVKEALEKRVAK